MLMAGPKTISLFSAFICGIMLLSTSQLVQGFEAKRRSLQQEIMKERQTIRFLEAEWAYLNNPARLDKILVTLNKQEVVLQEPNVVSISQPVPEPATPVIPLRKPTYMQALITRPAAKDKLDDRPVSRKEMKMVGLGEGGVAEDSAHDPQVQEPYALPPVRQPERLFTREIGRAHV